MLETIRAVRIRSVLVTLVFCCLRTPSTRRQAAGGEAGRGPDLGALGLGQKQVQRKVGLAAGQGPVKWRAADRIRPAPPPLLSVPCPPWRGTPHREEPQTQSAQTAAGTVISAPRPAPGRGGGAGGALRWVRARPLALSPAAGWDGSGKETRVRSPPGVLGDPSFICSFVHSTPSPCSRFDLESCLRPLPPRPIHQDLRASVPCGCVQSRTVFHSLRCPRPISATMLFTAVAPNWGLCVHCRPLGSGLNTAARGAITPPLPGSSAPEPAHARCAPVPCEASLTRSLCSTHRLLAVP